MAVSPHPLPGPGTYLLLEQQGHAREELVAIQGGERNVEEEPIEHRLGDPLQGERQQQQRETHQDTGAQRGQPGLLNVHNPAGARSTGLRVGLARAPLPLSPYL